MIELYRVYMDYHIYIQFYLQKSELDWAAGIAYFSVYLQHGLFVVVLTNMLI